MEENINFRFKKFKDSFDFFYRIKFTNTFKNKNKNLIEMIRFFKM